jgi:quinol monooxygenase YgiN
LAVQVIVELQAHPVRRGELMALLDSIVEWEGATQRGFLNSTRYEALDDPDLLIELAERESAEAQLAHLGEAAATRVYAPLLDLLAAPTRVDGHPAGLS